MIQTVRLTALISSLFFFTARATASPEVPGPDQNHPVALVGGTVHPVTGPEISGATVLFKKGKIAAIGRKVEIPEDAIRVNIKGQHVYPGLIDAYTHIGLVEVNAVRATRDVRETGRINPNARAHVAVNPDSELIPVTRSGGVLMCVVAPEGGLFSGTSALLQLDGWSYEDLTLRAPVGMHLRWPTMTPRRAWWNEESAKKQLEERDRALREIRDTIADARAYLKARSANGGAEPPRDARWEAMIPLLARKIPLVVEANEIRQIQAAVALAQQESLKLVIYGGYDAPHCAALLKKHNVPVIIAGVYRLPQRRSDDYDASYTLAGRLHSAGIRFCISGFGRFGASNVRNLPYHAATAVAFGLPKDEALKAITIYPAQILGAGRLVGSLEVGKDATLIVTDGDPLETFTHVEAAYMQGRPVDLNNRHKRLWRKYEEKYRRLDAK